MSGKYSVYSMEINKGLIDLLSTAQQNCELANERASSLIKHNQKLNKALDKACELLEEYSTYDDPTPKDEWKEQLLNG